tara:strand:- start:531 stop:755 length:225 start_codon:yes stop_codon:yes gene_type:complete
MKNLKNNSLDELFNEADFLMNRCKKNIEEIGKGVDELKSMQGYYLRNIENMLLFKVKEQAYELLNDSKRNELYD